jgi:hypothetical protein
VKTSFSLSAQTKICSKCQRLKPLDDFWKHPKRSFGRQAWCKQCYKTYLSVWSSHHRDLKNQRCRETHAKLRLEVLTYYSQRDLPECVCCGEQTIAFLAIDHINGGGRQHRKAIHNTYEWIKKNDFPDGFQTLCHNCNQARHLQGYCPHQVYLSI